MRNLKNFFLGILALGVVACGSDDDDNNNNNTAAPAPPQQQTPAAPPQGPTAPDGSHLLITGGSFVSEPVTDISRRYGGRACSLYELDTSGDQLTLRQKVRENADCTGALLGEVHTVGTITELQPESTTSHNFSLAIQSVKMIPHSILWTQQHGRGNSGDCQIELMPLRSENDVAGKTCGNLGTFPSVGDVFQSRYRFEGMNTLRLSFAPHELPNNVSSPDSPAAPRATRMNVTYTRVGTGGGTDTSTSTQTSTATQTTTATDTDTDTDTATDTATNTNTTTATVTNTSTDTSTATILSMR